MAFSQGTPQGISYQAVAYDSEGFEISNQEISVRLGILLGGVDAEASYTEVHSVTTDDFGLFSLVISQGETSDTFSSINWEEGAYLKVEVDEDLDGVYSVMGVSSFNAVPYALYAEKSNSEVAVSTFGDTLTINGKSLIIPGLSFANAQPLQYGTLEDIDGNIYTTVIIQGIEWMAEDLRVTSYSNGDDITEYNGSNFYSDIYRVNDYGISYGGYTIIDQRGLCPSGWHIATEIEWNNVFSLFADQLITQTECGGGCLLYYWDNSVEVRSQDPSQWSCSAIPGNNASGLNLENHRYWAGVNQINYEYYGNTSLIGFEIQCDNQIFRNYPNVTWSEYQVRCVKNQ